MKRTSNNNEVENKAQKEERNCLTFDQSYDRVWFNDAIQNNNKKEIVMARSTSTSVEAYKGEFGTMTEADKQEIEMRKEEIMEKVMEKKEAERTALIEGLIPAAIEMLATKYKPVRTARAIRGDLKRLEAAAGRSTAQGVNNTLSYLDSFDCNGWIDDIDTEKTAIGLYLSLTTWDEPLMEKYEGNGSGERSKFVRNNFYN